MITFSENQQKIVDRLKTERMLQAEFEQYAKEHGYIISTTNIIEQIRDEIDGIEINGQVDAHTMFIRTGEQVKQMALDIIDKYKGDKDEI